MSKRPQVCVLVIAILTFGIVATEALKYRHTEAESARFYTEKSNWIGQASHVEVVDQEVEGHRVFVVLSRFGRDMSGAAVHIEAECPKCSD